MHLSRTSIVVSLCLTAGGCASLDGLTGGDAQAADGNDGSPTTATSPDGDGQSADARGPTDAGHARDATDAKHDAREGGHDGSGTTDAADATAGEDAHDATVVHDATADAAPADAAPADGAKDARIEHDAHAPADAGLPDSSSCDAGIVHLASDSENCGACGHDCQGGACSGGACQPVIVASGTWGTGFIASDDQNVYWDEDENDSSGQADIFSIPIALDGGVPHDIAPLQDNPTSFVTSGGLIYYGLIYTKTIVSLSPSGTVSTLTTNAGMPQAVAVDGTNVYWTDIQRKAVMAVPLAGGAVQTIAPGVADMTEIAVDDTNVYWSEPSANAVVRAVKTGGGTPVTLCTQAPAPETIVIGGGKVYFASDAYSVMGGGIYAMATDGSGLTPLAGPLGEPYYVAVDETFAYWSGLGVGKVPLAGGQITTLVATGATYGVAVTPKSIFWVEAVTSTTNALLRLAK